MIRVCITFDRRVEIPGSTDSTLAAVYLAVGNKDRLLHNEKSLICLTSIPHSRGPDREDLCGN